jgi:hypothetical protein
MSIVALKRNSRRFIVPISANGFSLNGGYRNQRSIGDTNLSALTVSQERGCCSYNDPSIAKMSVKNTKGYLYSAIVYPTCPAGVIPPANNQSNWFKNFSPENRSQGVYVMNVKASAATCVTVKTDSGASNPCLPNCVSRSYWIGGKRFYTTFNAKNSGEYGQGAISAGEYLSAGLLKYNCLPPPTSIATAPPGKEYLVHTPPALLNSGCYHC